jgi:hypothetical protein
LSFDFKQRSRFDSLTTRFDRRRFTFVQLGIERPYDATHLRLQVRSLGVVSSHFYCLLAQGIGDGALVVADLPKPTSSRDALGWQSATPMTPNWHP